MTLYQESISLTAALNDFSMWCSAKYAPRTNDTYRRGIDKFLAFIEGTTLPDITIVQVNNFFIHCQRQRYSAASLHSFMVAIRGFCKFLFLQKLLSWDYQLVPVPRYTNKSHRPIQQQEADQMIDSMRISDFKGLRDKTIMALLYSSGLRVSELCDLLVSDLDLCKKFGTIVSKKNRVKRMVFWDTRTQGLLTEYLKEREGRAKCDNVFISTDRKGAGGSLRPRTIQRLVARYRVIAGITPHSFRHGLGVRCVQANIHPREIQKILGHKNINSSQVYMQVYDEDMLKAYQKVANYRGK